MEVFRRDWINKFVKLNSTRKTLGSEHFRMFFLICPDKLDESGGCTGNGTGTLVWENKLWEREGYECGNES